MTSRPPRTDHTHVLLLRGINLGARNRVPKEDLVRWAEQAGARDVTTHLASGNILFRVAGEPGAGPVSADAVAAGVREAARAERGLDVPVLWASVAELRAALAEHHALPWAGGDPKHTTLTLLSAAPDADAAARLAALPHRRDHSAVRGRHLWMRHLDGVADSPLTLARIERALGVTGTARNLATVRALAGVTESATPPREDRLGVLIWGATHVHVQDHRDAVARHTRAHLARAEVAEVTLPDLDGVGAVILDGATAHHAAQVRALPPGMPVFVEKPLGLTLEDARDAAAVLAGRLHTVGFFLPMLPAVERWIHEVRAAVERGEAPALVEISSGHDGRVSGMFTGPHAWMVDPARGGSGNFADLAIHAVHLIRRLGLGALEPVSCTLEPAADGLSDAGGTAVLRAGRTEIHLSVSAQHAREFTATASVTAATAPGLTSDCPPPPTWDCPPLPTWQVRGGVLFRDGVEVLRGPGPDASLAATAFLDAVTGSRDVAAATGAAAVSGLSGCALTDAAEALAVQEDLEAILGRA